MTKVTAEHWNELPVEEQEKILAMLTRSPGWVNIFESMAEKGDALAIETLEQFQLFEDELSA